MADENTQAFLDQGILDLVLEIRTLLNGITNSGIAPFIAAWPMAPAINRAWERRELPVLRWLSNLPALANDATRPITELLVKLAPHLRWRQTYGIEDFGADFLQRYGWTELVGTRGPIASDEIAVGFLMLGPANHYPEHYHDAEEIYLPMAGEAMWKRGISDWQSERPGTFIPHASREVHATRTTRDPLLALYLWRGGDLAQKPSIGGSSGHSASGT